MTKLTGALLVDHLYYKKLPRVYQIMDVEVNQDRPLYRYLQSLILGGYDPALTEITDVVKLVDPITCPAQYFPKLCASWGMPYFEDIDLLYQRKILSNVGEIRKRRGTYSCVKYLVRVLTGLDVTLTTTFPIGGRLLTITIVADTIKAVTGLDNSFAVIERYVKYFLPYYIDVVVDSNVRVQTLNSSRKRFIAMSQGYRYNLIPNTL